MPNAYNSYKYGNEYLDDSMHIIYIHILIDNTPGEKSINVNISRYALK